MNDTPKRLSTPIKETCPKTVSVPNFLDAFGVVIVVAMVALIFFALASFIKRTDQDRRERKSQLIKQLTGKDVLPEDVHMIEIVVGSEQ